MVGRSITVFLLSPSRVRRVGGIGMSVGGTAHRAALCFVAIDSALSIRRRDRVVGDTTSRVRLSVVLIRVSVGGITDA